MRRSASLVSTALSIAFFLVVCPAHSWAETSYPSSYLFPGFDVRYGLGGGLGSDNLSALLEKPSVFSTEVAAKDGRVESRGEAHVLLDLEPSKIASVIGLRTDLSRNPPGILKIDVESVDGPRTVATEFVGMDFLGLNAGSRVRIEGIWDELQNGERGYRTRILESFDGRVIESFTSWFIAPVSVGNRTMSYIHIYVHSRLKGVSALQAAVLKAYIPKQLRDMLAFGAREARRRRRRR